MPKWEIRRVSGKGFLKDIPVAAYGNLDRQGVEDLKLVHKPRAIAPYMDFLVVDHLAGKTSVGAADLDALQTCWEGKPLPVGAVYCAITDFEDSAKDGSSLVSLKKAVQLQVADRVVDASKRNPFSSAGATAARQRLQAQAVSTGGIWGRG